MVQTRECTEQDQLLYATCTPFFSCNESQLKESVSQARYVVKDEYFLPAMTLKQSNSFGLAEVELGVCCSPSIIKVWRL